MTQEPPATPRRIDAVDARSPGTPADCDVHELLPHRGPMRLLDRVLVTDEDGLIAEAVVRDEWLFAQAGEVEAWAGVELMAQAAAAWAGWRARRQGCSPRTGYLLSARRYECLRPTFRVGERLEVEVRCSPPASGSSAAFVGTIRAGAEPVAQAALTVVLERGDRGSEDG